VNWWSSAIGELVSIDELVVTGDRWSSVIGDWWPLVSIGDWWLSVIGSH